MFTAVLFTIAKTWNQPKCPLMTDWIKKMWQVYIMKFYAAIKRDEFMSFAGTWIKLETIILIELTWEQKMKYCMFSLIGGWWTMRTHGHREGSITHWGLLGGNRGGMVGGGVVGRDSMGRNARYRWRGGRQQIPLPRVYLCNYLACLHMYPKTYNAIKKEEEIKKAYHVIQTIQNKHQCLLYRQEI